MADLGVGIGGGVLIEVVKGIWTVYEQVKENKEEAKQLITECEETHNLLTKLLRQTEENGLQHGPIYETVYGYISKFEDILDRINLTMTKWVDKDPFERMWKVSKMSKKIEKHMNEVLAMWKEIQLAISMQTLAGNEAVRDLVISNGQTLCAMKDALVKIAFETARRADNQANAEALRDLTSTVHTVDGKISNSHLLIQTGFTSVLRGQEQLAQTIKDYHNPGDTTPDADVTQAQNELIQALEAYTGERPVFTIDSSELTFPLKGRPNHLGATVRKGIYRQNQAVAIKNVIVDFSMVKIPLDVYYRRIIQESKIRQALKHPNIVDFIGCCSQRGEVPCLVSDWMSNGNVLKFIETNPEANCVKLCLDIANGLVYIHSRSPPIIHGGLKGSNILVDNDGTAKLGDFALALTDSDIDTGSRSVPPSWTAPEILKGGGRTPSSDIYSLACVMIEIFTGQDPFPTIRNPHKLSQRIRDENLRPEFPDTENSKRRGLTSSSCALWKLMEACWAETRADRPDALKARDALAEILESIT